MNLKPYAKVNTFSLEETHIYKPEIPQKKRKLFASNLLRKILLLLRFLYGLLVFARIGFFWALKLVDGILNTSEIILLFLLGLSDVLFDLISNKSSFFSKYKLSLWCAECMSLLFLIIAELHSQVLDEEYLTGSINFSRVLMIFLLSSKQNNYFVGLISQISKVLLKILLVDEVKEDGKLSYEVCQAIQELKKINSSNASNETIEDLNNPSIVINLLEIPDIDQYNFDVFAFHSQTSNNSLVSMMMYLFNRYNSGFLDIPEKEFTNFIISIQNGYKNNPYHNAIHASDVVQSVHFYLYSCEISMIYDFSIENKTLLIISAAIHDFKHPGVTNGFLINTKHRLATLYNDMSVLENYHVSSAFGVIHDQTSSDIFKNVSFSTVKAYRKAIISMVLSTDMSKHMQNIEKLERIGGKKNLNEMEKGDLMESLIHAGDISNPSRNWELYKKWADLISEEYFAQGDMERNLNLSISPLCDRYNCTIYNGQIGFIKNFVKPMFKTVQKIAPMIKVCVKQCKENMKKIEDQL